MSAKTNFENKIKAKYPHIQSVLEYTSAKNPATIECTQGHKWKVIPSNLVSKGSGSQCPACTGNAQYELIDGVYTFTKTKTSISFSYQLRQINSEVSLVSEYSGAHKPVTLKCSNGHIWEAIPTNILTRHTDAFCSICSPKWKKYQTPLPEAQSKISAHYPELELLEYTGSGKECLIKSNQCGHQFTSWFTNLVQGRGYRCPTCIPVYNRSKNELAIEAFIRSKYSGWIETGDRTIIKPKELDIVLPDLGLAIEYNSPYTHHDKDHLLKTTLTEAMGFRLVHINEDEWQTKQGIVKSRIESLLGASLVIGARKCSVRKINFPGEFLEANHIQGAGAPTNYNYGLFLQDELVAVMTFGKPRFSTLCEYELIRYCSLIGVTIAGGASKLLKAFRQDYPNRSILSYSDKRWSVGNLYKSLGFQLDHTSSPGYAYYKNSIKLSRFQCQKHKLEAMFPEYYDPALTEGQIMELAGYNRMYDCGTDVWVLR